MSASENNPSGLAPHEDHHADRASPRQDFIPADDLIALERARIDNSNRQVEAGRELIAASDRNDQRQFEFHTNRLEREMELHHTRHKTYKVVIYAVVLASVATIWFLLYNAFYGEGGQKEYGQMIAKYLAISVAGYGVISGITSLFKRLMKSDEE